MNRCLNKFLILYTICLIVTVNGYLVGFSEKELLSTLCLSFQANFIQCQIDQSQHIYTVNGTNKYSVPIFKQSSISENVFGIILFPSTNGYSSYGVLESKGIYPLLTINDNDYSSPLLNVPTQIKQSSYSFFGLPYQSNHVKATTKCSFAISQSQSNLYAIIPSSITSKQEQQFIYGILTVNNVSNYNASHENRFRNEKIKLFNDTFVTGPWNERDIPTNIILKATNTKYVAREFLYTTLLANSVYPIKPTASYGMGLTYLTISTVCFSSSKLTSKQSINSYTLNQQNNLPLLGGLLITERPMGPTIRDVISFLRGKHVKDWIDTASNQNIKKYRLALKLESQYAVLHSTISAILTLQYHSILGRLLHCDLSTRNIHLVEIYWDWTYKNVIQNMQSLAFLSPSNIRFNEFSELRSTLEISEDQLRCYTSENDLFRVQSIVKSIFYEQTNRTIYPETGSMERVGYSIGYNIKSWWYKNIDGIFSTVTPEEFIQKQKIQIEHILSVTLANTVVTSNLDKISKFLGITTGIRIIHKAISESYNYLNKMQDIPSKNRNMTEWSVNDIPPFPPSPVNKEVKSLLNNQRINKNNDRKQTELSSGSFVAIS